MREKNRSGRTALVSAVLAVCVSACAYEDATPEVSSGAAALETTFTTLTYNVAGLLEPFSGSDPAVNTPIISCLVRGYDVVVVQEDFNYHAALYDTCDDHPNRSPTTGGMGIGSGLNTLSYFPYIDFSRVTWDACDGVDCLTPKGFTMARVRLAEGVYVDVYDLHAQAGTGAAPFQARRANILQLARYIEAQSAGNAVIIAGDTNTRYTRSEDNVRELLARGFRDVWVDLVRGGDVPAQGAAPLMSCEPVMTSAGCEVVDKVLYRSSRAIRLQPLDYLVEHQRFVDGDGEPLSDHAPVKVTWRLTTAPDLRLSDTAGGPHGQGFNDVALLPAAPRVNQVALRSGERLDQISVTLSNGVVLRHGGGGGSPASLALAGGEHVASIRLCSGQRDGQTRIFRAEVRTNLGRVLAGGSTTSSCVSFSAPAGWQIAGFHGRSGDEVDRLGVVFAPVVGTAPAPSPVRLINRASGRRDGRPHDGDRARPPPS